MQNPDDIATTMKTVTAVLEQVIQMSYVVRKPVLPYANNKGAEQIARPRSLISAFVFAAWIV